MNEGYNELNESWRIQTPIRESPCNRQPGGIILVDEYNDPPWPGCNKAVDEFLIGKPETLKETDNDNQVKYFIQKYCADTTKNGK